MAKSVKLPPCCGDRWVGSGHCAAIRCAVRDLADGVRVGRAGGDHRCRDHPAFAGRGADRNRYLASTIGTGFCRRDRAPGRADGSQWARFTAAAVFVAFWMPLCSGLRSEALIVLGSLLTWWGVEQAIATCPMLPAAGATLAACLTPALAPHGVIAVAILIAGSRPMLRNLRRRAGELGITLRNRRIPRSGLFAMLAPSGVCAFAEVTADQCGVWWVRSC